MRKAIIEITPNKMVRGMWGNFFGTVDRLEGREILQLNFEKGIKLVIVDFFMKKGYTIDDVKLPNRVEILKGLQNQDLIITNPSGLKGGEAVKVRQ